MQVPIRLREHERNYVALREDDASLIQRKLADVLPLSSTADPGRYVLKASSHVGVVHLPSGRTVVIEPKVRIDTLFALLSAVYDPAKEILRDEPYPHTSVAALFEFVVAIFVRHVEDLIARGLLRSYQTRT
jgi:hypothetical protein